MSKRDDTAHPFIHTLKQQLADGGITRREFLRTATLLGLSAGAAYSISGAITGQAIMPQARAQDLPRGGTLRLSMRLQELNDPHTYSWNQSDVTRNVCEYLTRTDQDNVTRPFLLQSWQPSEDLRTWTLNLRKDVTWHNGRAFVADDVIWNLEHVLDPATGSSVLGLMGSYMLVEYDTGTKNDKGEAVKSQRLWDASAIEKVDDHTVRLNCKEPQLAIPEHLFHYPMHILDPEENGKFGPGSNGTGAFELVEMKVGETAVLKARKNYWGTGPYLDTVQLIDLGDDPSAGLGALASKQVDGLEEVDISLIDVIENLDHVQVYETTTAQTGVARMKVDQKPFDDPRVRKAMRLAIDCQRTFELGHRGRGAVGQHHHCSPVHPEFAEIEFMKRDVDAAKKLLSDAGHPGGIDVELTAKTTPAWEMATVQAMVEQWKEAGIRVRINPMPGAKFWDVWDKVPFGFTEWTHRPLAVMVMSLAYRSGAPWNESGYANPDLDALLIKAEGIPDPKQRAVVMAEVQTLMQEDGPIVQPLWRAVFAAFDKRVKGFKMHPTSYVFAEQLAMES